MQKIGICLLLSLLVGISGLMGQDKMSLANARKVFGEQKVLNFQRFSLELTAESKMELDLAIDLINAYPAMVRDNLIMLQAFTCEDELAVKPYLGVCRSQKLVDYMHARIGVPRKKCLIMDKGPSEFDKDCLFGSGVMLYLGQDCTNK